MTRKLHEHGYAVVVTDDDGEEFVYEDVIDFGPLWEDGQLVSVRVKTEAHPMLLFEPPPESVNLVRSDAL